MRTRVLVALAALTGCYDLPLPECGFECGTGGSCPSGYTCVVAERICRRDDAERSCIDPFSGKDYMPPDTFSLDPPRDGTDVRTNVDISVQFDERVFGVSGETFHLENASTGAVVHGVVSSNDNTEARIRLLSRLDRGVTYRVTLDADVITDIAGNRFEGLTWMFTTDQTPPAIAQTFPADGATGVPVNLMGINVTFSEAVTSVDATNFRLIDVGGSDVPCDVRFTDGAFTAALHPQLQLEPLTTYQIVLGTSILDTSYNAFPGYRATFQTGIDSAAPVITLLEPEPPFGIPLGSRVRVQFDEPVVAVDATSFRLDTLDGAPIDADVSYDAATRIATLVPTSQLPASTTLALRIGPPIADRYGNTATYYAQLTTGVDDSAPFVPTSAPPVTFTFFTEP